LKGITVSLAEDIELTIEHVDGSGDDDKELPDLKVKIDKSMLKLEVQEKHSIHASLLTLYLNTDDTVNYKNSVLEF
jgi:hypothetical protein